MLRPRLHFTPPQGWLNDPNGPIWHEETFHLFYQHQPHQRTWGPMHWGHATSRDLLHWRHEPIALFPDAKGAAFSGSAFPLQGKMALAYTLDHPKHGQRQALATDNGDRQSFSRQRILLADKSYADFRDPKLFWHEGCKHYVMVLAAGDHARIYTSRDLTDWQLSDTIVWPSLAGVWECPDLFPLSSGDRDHWVFLLSLNVPVEMDRMGFGMVYFVGDFDGRKFIVRQGPRRLDAGLDFYAGVTFSQRMDRRILIGWMNCWHYANEIPCDGVFRGSMSLPRELAWAEGPAGLDLCQKPLRELSRLPSRVTANEQEPHRQKVHSPCFSLSGIFAAQGRIVISRGEEQVVIGLGERVWLDRSRSGKADFSPHFAPVLMTSRRRRSKLALWLLHDGQSIELFIDSGRETLTALVFPRKAYDCLSIEGTRVENLIVQEFEGSADRMDANQS